MSAAAELEHRCNQCQNWSAHHERCRGAQKSRASARLGNLTIRDKRNGLAREFLDEAALQDINARWGAVQDWWIVNHLGAYNEDHIAAVVLDFDDMPIGEVIATLTRTLARAKTRPYSLRYFKVALQEARGEFFKRQDSPRRRDDRSTGDVIAGILGRAQGGQGGRA